MIIVFFCKYGLFQNILLYVYNTNIIQDIGIDVGMYVQTWKSK